jgi:phytanoyl-CoA hydroxylase
MLSREQLERWRADGLLVLEGFKPAAETAALRERALAIVDVFEPQARDRTAVFSTLDRSLLADTDLLASSTAIRCFFEAEALDAEGDLKVPKRQSINKIGHALHDLDPVFERFSRDPRLAELVHELGVEVPQLWQSMLIFKQPAIGGEVTWHQDASFLGTEPQTVIGLWFALEDAGPDNGCLWVQAEGGARAPLRERFVHLDGRLQMQPLNTTPWPTAAQARALPVPAGTLVVLHGQLPHYSAPNRSAHSRMAYTLHVTDGRARYSPLNWLQRGPQMPVRGF